MVDSTPPYVLCIYVCFEPGHAAHHTPPHTTTAPSAERVAWGDGWQGLTTYFSTSCEWDCSPGSTSTQPSGQGAPLLFVGVR